MSLFLRVSIECRNPGRSDLPELPFTATREITFRDYDDPAIARTLERVVEAAKTLVPLDKPFKPPAESPTAT